MTTPQPALPATALTAFLHFCHLRRYPAKTTVIHPGDIGDKLMFVVEGSVSVSVEDEDGHELILAYLNQHDFIGEIGVFKTLEPRSASVKTRCATQLAEIGYDRFRWLLHHDLREHAIAILSALGEQLSNRLLSNNRKFYDLAFLDVEGRVARTLIELSQQPHALSHPDGLQISVTRQELGRMVGCSREMAGRVLKELEDKGLITAHGKTVVVLTPR